MMASADTSTDARCGVQGTIVSVETITGPKATGETCNIVIDTRGEIPYWEGQSYGVIPPVSC